MCGICGELTFGGQPVLVETIVAMRDRLLHRGPDDEGVYLSPDRRAGLGFRRLRIIDLSAAANQPMSNEDGSVRVVFNGEIYNFQDLRKDLARRGHQFRSHSDTEVIVHLYEEAGDRFAEQLDGMFAIGLWDDRRQRLVLARDRAGKKPLFYCQQAERVVFGSEIKAMLAHPDVIPAIDEARLPSYFLFGYVPHPSTFYRGVRQVDPGSTVAIESDGRARTERYWQLRFPDAVAPPRVDRSEARTRVKELVTAAVARRLVSDVPLGAFLSAGIDSTIVVGIMSQLTGAPVKTFTIGFEGDAAYDETETAQRVAARFQTEHTEFRVRPTAVDLIDRLIWHHDGPFGDSSAIPTFLVSELTRSHVTVVLTGDGGDEAFAGYLRFRAALAAARFPAVIGPVISAVLKALPAGPNERHILSRMRRFARFMHLPLLERVARWNSVFQQDLDSLLEPSVLTDRAVDPLENIRTLIGGLAKCSPLGQLLAANFASYLPDDLLVKTDRCTMANSLEARCPFLDTGLIEYVASLPDDFKLQGSTTKAILREAFADLIPPEVNQRSKTGFGVPLDEWFRGELRDYVRDVLLTPSASYRTYVRQAAVRGLVDEHQAGQAHHGQRLWALVCFERWLQLLPEWTITGRRGTMVAPLS